MANLQDQLEEALRYHESGNLAAAEQLYRKILEEQPEHCEALFLLGTLHLQRQSFDSAVSLLRRAVALDPNHARAHDNLGVALRKQDNLDEALASCSRAIELEPNLYGAHNNKAAILRALGKADQAVESYRQAIQLKPDFADAHSNLGVALAALGRFDEAESACRRALALKPNSFNAYHSLGCVMHDAGRNTEAVKCFGRAVQLQPGSAIGYRNLATSLRIVDQPDAAIASYQKAIELQPDYADALNGLGGVFAEQAKTDEARNCYLRAIRIQPENALWKLRADSLCPTVFFSNEEIDQYRHSLETALEKYQDAALKVDWPTIQSSDCRPSFNLPFHGKNDRSIKERFAAIFEPAFPREKPAFGSGPPRVGFVVTRAHERAFCRLIGGSLEHFTPGALRPTIICSQSGEQEIRPQIRNPEVSYLTITRRIEHAAEAIRAGSFDLLYHWEIGTDPLNYFLPFSRLAPIQCTSWGIQVTSGIPAMDYYLSSELIEIDQADAHYSERLVRLKTMLSYHHRLPVPKTVRSRDHFGLPENGNLYLCPQHLGKFHPDFDEVLEAILLQDPLGNLVITRGSYPAPAQKLQDRFRAKIPKVADRILWVPQQGGDDYNSLILQADVLLDPLHFGGVNTSYDAFSFGKAVVTRPSQFHCGRYTLGCYQMMGITDCVAGSQDEYVELAVKIATDTDYRASIEAKIRDASPILFENAEVARELENFFLEAIEQAR